MTARLLLALALVSSLTACGGEAAKPAADSAAPAASAKAPAPAAPAPAASASSGW